jgi:hypothetical protein
MPQGADDDGMLLMLMLMMAMVALMLMHSHRPGRPASASGPGEEGGRTPTWLRLPHKVHVLDEAILLEEGAQLRLVGVSGDLQQRGMPQMPSLGGCQVRMGCRHNLLGVMHAVPQRRQSVHQPQHNFRGLGMRCHYHSIQFIAAQHTGAGVVGCGAATTAVVSLLQHTRAASKQ